MHAGLTGNRVNKQLKQKKKRGKKRDNLAAQQVQYGVFKDGTALNGNGTGEPGVQNSFEESTWQMPFQGRMSKSHSAILN